MSTITTIATGNPDFSILVATLIYLDDTIPESALVATLDDPTQSLTVFAPNNAAFGTLATELGFAGDASDTTAVTSFLVSNVPATTLNEVVLYHVAGGSLSSTDIAALDEVTTLQGGTITTDLPTLVDKEPDLTDPSLVALDIAADNGTIHVIDKVLLPVDLPGNDAPTLTGIVAASGGEFDTDSADFDILLNAVLTADLDEVLASDQVDLTVFAPTDQAFINLAQELGYAENDEAGAWSFLVDTLTELGDGDPIPLLSDILTYHVTGESLQASQVLSASQLETLQGSVLGVDGTTLIDAATELDDPTIIATDIQASNGVVHVIDNVLMPIDIEVEKAPSLTDIVAASGGEFDSNAADFDILLNAVLAAGLADTLASDAVDLTVFAPTDQAFIDLAGALGYDGADEEGAWGYLVDSLTLIGGGDPIPLLTEILTYHVAGESLDATAVLSASEIETLQGGSLGVNGTALVDAEPDLSDQNIIETNIEASNGIVHVIDGVLLPVDLSFDARNELIIRDDGNNFEIAGRGDDLIALKGGNDILFGGRGNDFALGGAGEDFMNMGRGDDTASGGEEDDFIRGSRGDDLLSGDAGDDFISGGRDDDTIFGGEGDDFLRGDRGNDTLDGGLGNDQLKGSGGEDVFVYASGYGMDQIKDFEDGSDKVDLSGAGIADFDALAALAISDGNRTVIALDDENSLRINGLSEEEFDASDFIL